VSEELNYNRKSSYSTFISCRSMANPTMS